ncbi:MerR family DNA-binding transcriptional regulator [Streptosporangium subroseum]|uniref:MerR family transcriptional regulator n=1 Tax=Streptosporangium subroseum TaxID=106412 RepID=UPI0034372B63
MITIGRLARYAGVSIKTIRVYHDKGLLPEPGRDSSGYRRYTAQHAIDLIKIRTLAEAGVPLARVRELRAASDENFQKALHHVDTDLTARIRGLRETQRRLRRLAAGRLQMLLPEVSSHLDQLPELGFSPRWVALETDLWILVFATHPDTAIELFHDQAQALTDPVLRQLYLDYDRARDLDPHDPRVDDLAWLHPSGREMTNSDWEDHDLRAVGMFVSGAPLRQPGPHGGQLVDASFLTWFNASAEPLDIVLPENDWAQRGFVVLSTDAALGVGTPPAAGQSITIGPRTVVVMRST